MKLDCKIGRVNKTIGWKTTLLTSIFFLLTSVFFVSWEGVERGKYVDVSGKWSRYFTLTPLSERKGSV
jgi:hypothetical protein